MLHKSFRYLGAGSLMLLAACGSDDNDNNHSSSSVASTSSSSSVEASSSVSSSSSSIALTAMNGLAAVGAAISNATVTAKCADGSSFTTAVMTNNQGAFSGSVTTGALPCALKVSGGTPDVTLHSYTSSGGRVNITPFTDLVLANATNRLPQQWFTDPDWTVVTDHIDAATGELKTALEEAGYDLPDGDFLPFTESFAIGDEWDQVLDDLQLAIDSSTSIDSYAALIDLIRQGSLGTIPFVTGSNTSSSSSSSQPTSSSSSSSSSSVSSSASGGTQAQQCFNPELSREGTQVVSEYRATDGDSGSIINFSYDQTIFGSTSFNGATVRFAVSDTVATGAAPSQSTSTSYFTVNEAAARSEALGVEVVTSSPISTTVVTTNNPGRLSRYDLSIGESYSQTFTSTTQVMGFDVSTPISFTTTFVGIEDVTVPAGTYSACRFETDEGGQLTTHWFAVQTGVELKVVSGGDETIFIGGSINGVDL
ncbi:MAG TPA: hypothetical protein VIC08_03955 [Cellvibrionaceae bacterium]